MMTEAQAAQELLNRLADLEAAMHKAHNILGTMSMATEGHLRGRICTVYNILGKPLGKGRSSHGSVDDG